MMFFISFLILSWCICLLPPCHCNPISGMMHSRAPADVALMQASAHIAESAPTETQCALKASAHPLYCYDGEACLIATAEVDTLYGVTSDGWTCKTNSKTKAALTPCESNQFTQFLSRGVNGHIRFNMQKS